MISNALEEKAKKRDALYDEWSEKSDELTSISDSFIMS